MRSTDKDGKVKEVALTAQQLEHVTQLVKDAVGFDEARGDNVNVVNASLHGRADRTRGRAGNPGLLGVAAVPEHREAARGPRRVARPHTVGPAADDAQPGRPHPPAGAAHAAHAAESIATEPIQAGGNNNPALPGADPKAVALTHEQQVAAARTLVNQDAKRVAQVVRGWVAQDE